MVKDLSETKKQFAEREPVWRNTEEGLKNNDI